MEVEIFKCIDCGAEITHEEYITCGQCKPCFNTRVEEYEAEMTIEDEHQFIIDQLNNQYFGEEE